MTRSYASGVASKRLIGETIGENLERTVQRFGDREALVVRHQGVRLTYAELDARVNALARGLLAAGLGAGRPRRHLGAELRRVGARAVRDREGRDHPRQRQPGLPHERARVRAAPLRLPDADRRAVVQDQRLRGHDRGGPRRPAGARARRAARLARSGTSWPAGGDADLPADLDPDDAINIQYTSGTTGFPKGATLSHHNILNNAFFVGEGCGYDEHDRVCIPVPFYHCFGMVMGNLGCTTHGATMVVPDAAFDPVAVLATVQEERCTSLYGVPTMFIAELSHPDFSGYDLSTLRTGIMAGSPCPIEVMKQVIERMHMDEVTICYGMTETSPVSTQTGAGDSLEKRTQTVGRCTRTSR